MTKVIRRPAKNEFKHEREGAQVRPEYVDPLPSKTDQSFRKETDVNSIMSKYAKTGQITHLARTTGIYADVSTIKDLQSAYDTVDLAQAAFNTLPSALREELANDPTRLPGFLQDPKNKQKAIDYGLINKPEPVPLVPSKEEPKAPTPAPPTPK